MGRAVRRILVTGGSGFVGSSLALAVHRGGIAQVVVLDNLKRRGSELTLARLTAEGIQFRHGDVRCPEDLADVGPVDAIIECSAEPSAIAGYGGGARYLVNTNLGGTFHCLEHARACGAAFLFLSTSRVYPVAPLRALPLVETGDRLDLPAGAAGPGFSDAGVSEDFPLSGSRTLYGATKLASELLITEYSAMYGMPGIVLRCGVLAGPWQMGKVDQGFMALWVARHVFGLPLAYIGFGGGGLQVRDVLHVDDLCDLVALILADLPRFSGRTFNAGGGRAASTSLKELTTLCRRVTGRTVPVGAAAETRDGDIPWYVTDAARLTAFCGWRPRRGVAAVVEDIHRWITDNRDLLRPILAT